MLKKALVAGVVVVVALLVVSYAVPKRFAAFCHWVKERRDAAEDSLPPEQEIALLKAKLANLEKEDERHYHKVAVQTVEVQKLEKRVEEMRARLDRDAGLIRARKASLVGEDKLVTYEGNRYDRARFTEELRQLAARFQVEDQELKSLEEQLRLRKSNLELNKRKLAELKLVRQQMKTELERLETALAAARQSEAAEKNTIDDASYRQLRKDLDGVKDKLEVMKQKQILRGEVEGPVRAAEERKQRDEAIDRYLNEDPRFNDAASSNNANKQ